MAAGRSTNTMEEGLYKALASIAQMATAPDADLQFLTKLQVDITQFLRNPGGSQGGQQGPPPQDPSQGGGGPPGGMPPMATGGAMPGLSPSGSPSMDEISRILGGSASPGGAA